MLYQSAQQLSMVCTPRVGVTRVHGSTECTLLLGVHMHDCRVYTWEYHIQDFCLHADMGVNITYV